MPVFDKAQSKIKMVILTKGKAENVIWWSPIKQNKRKSELVIRSMLKRLKNDKELFSHTNVVHYYENNVLIAEIKF
jgi:hypothetical protein